MGAVYSCVAAVTTHQVRQCMWMPLALQAQRTAAQRLWPCCFTSQQVV